MTKASSTPLKDLFEREGEPSVIGGNCPFVLDDPDCIWWVASGHVEVFSTEVRGDQPHGQRHHFCSAAPGQALFGLRGGAELGRGLLAVGAQNTRLLRLSLERLRECSKEPALRPEIAALVATWTAALSGGLSQDIAARTDVVADVRQEIRLKTNERMRAHRGMLWVEIVEGSGLFLGMEEVSQEGGSRVIPLSSESWLMALSDMVLKTHATEDVVGTSPLWLGLESFYEMLFCCEAMNRNLLAADEYNRLVERVDLARSAREQALASLSTVLKPPEAAVLAEAGGDHLLGACMLVGNAAGIGVRQHADARKGLSQKDPLSDIIRASRIRVRQVRLRGRWWTEEIGPLLGFLSDGHRPVALLPAKARRAVMVDPATEQRKEVNESIASDLEPQAWTLYRPLPERPVRGADLVRFSIESIRTDLKRMLAAGMICGALSCLIPFAFRYVVNRVMPAGELGPLYALSIALIMSVIAGTLFEISRNITLLRIEGKTDSSLQAAVMDRLLRLPASFYRDFSAGDLTERVLTIFQIRRLLSGTALISILGVLFSAFSFAVLFYFDARLAAVVACLLVAAGLANFLGTYLQLRYLRPAVNLAGKISGMVFQFVTAISKLRVAGAEVHAFASWAKQFAEQRTLTLNARRIANCLQAFNNAFPVAVTLVMFLVIGLSRQRWISPGDFIAFNTAMIAFVAAMLTTSTSLTSLLRIGPLYERVKPILEATPEVTEAKADPGQLTGAIEITNVSFRYHPDDPTAVDTVSLSINPGEFVAFAGPSGSGKSTLLRLIIGFYPPDTGTVSYDGQDLSALNEDAVRQQMGVVLQNSQLMPGDIFSNIAGSKPLTLEEAWEAARLAGLDKDIEELPMGMNTAITGGASTFSGGQKQRLLIARAIAGGPPVLVFDEATCALDNRSQAVVTGGLEKMQATRLLVAHRLSTVLNADRIYVLDKGKIVESGTYEELMRRDGLFAELAKRQLIEDEPVPGFLTDDSQRRTGKRDS